MIPKIVALSKSKTHTLQKFNCESFILLEGLGVEGDAHMGKTIKHRSRVAKDPSKPNFRQVHLIHIELLDELEEKGFKIKPGQMGENITTKGIDLLDLPTGSILQISSAKLKITGLRNPCVQLDGIQKGLMQAVLDRDVDGNLIRKAGVMGVVLEGGEISVGDKIVVDYPEKPHLKLEKI